MVVCDVGSSSTYAFYIMEMIRWWSVMWVDACRER